MSDFADLNEMKVSSVGDRFPQALFNQVESVFDRVINFVNGDLIVSLVTPEIGSGPFRIVLQGLVPAAVKEIELTSDAVIINADFVLPYSEKQIYISKLDFYQVNSEKMKKGIALINSRLQALNNTNTITYLLSQNLEKTTIAGFDLELAKQFQKAYKQLLAQDFQSAASGFRGRGFGLTPAGDDFNAGLLMGLVLRELTEKKELSKIRSYIYHNSLGKDLLVNTFLLQVYHSWYDEKWKNLLLALCENCSDLENAVEDVLAQGETSGADTLAGFLSAWEIKI
ncbi:MAG: DUF2877 domain-containing protein [Candidatus Cloacimonadaceae bacterium]